MLALPVTPSDLLAIIRRTLALFPQNMADDRAALMLLATALQETGGRTRVQLPAGAGRGFCQMQENAITDISRNPAVAKLFIQICDALGVPYAPRKLYGRLTSNDDLGFALDRLLFWCDPLPLPAVGDAVGGWSCYLRVQRPGKPSQPRWLSYSYPTALALFKAPS